MLPEAELDAMRIPYRSRTSPFPALWASGRSPPPPGSSDARGAGIDVFYGEVGASSSLARLHVGDPAVPIGDLGHMVLGRPRKRLEPPPATSPRTRLATIVSSPESRIARSPGYRVSSSVDWCNVAGRRTGYSRPGCWRRDPRTRGLYPRDGLMSTASLWMEHHAWTPVVSPPRCWVSQSEPRSVGGTWQWIRRFA